MNKIIVLGANGMLGQMVYKYFTKHNYEVIVIRSRFEVNNFASFIDEINALENGIVINCIGVIKQKSTDISELLWGNSILPLELARSLKQEHVLIQPSTDCIFNGRSVEPYDVDKKSDANDIYGWSKSLAETAVLSRSKSLIMRVSIIGPDMNSNKGLLSWFLSNSEKSQLKGFTNHLWNGITTLEWCKKLEEIIIKDHNLLNLNNQRLVQLGTENIYSKFKMLCKFQGVFKTNFTIVPHKTEDTVNRCLKPQIASPSLEEQLIELNAFMEADKS
jgi:dTDP-4-dehydrorhamnose reductase